MNPVEKPQKAPKQTSILEVAASNTLPSAQAELKPLSAEEAIIKLVSLAPDYPKFSIKSLAIFGSVARNEARPNSDADVDILVEFFTEPTFDMYIDLKLHLETLLKRKVNLTDLKMLRPEIIPKVMEDAIPINLVQFNRESQPQNHSIPSPEEVIISIIRNSEQIAKFGVKAIALFGSVARDEARPDSDIDILVEFEGTPTFRNYVKLNRYLEDLLGRKVDLVDWDTLRPEIRSNVEKDIIPIA
ncbi:nucleotidyltransferase family protein [Gloeocapsopsis sp. IPPAS B-1203]|uniref:nucleotidyltransferase family protein n=1 Tax=Gloeocapsopsis sp. IPPAS B-1203 TaxID=2049454 RepID=UPI000C19ABA7|nr:nucleotidyltransferase family protein [Gloeocapsopsis sp. IPPAS B-1203]PIG91568.1 DNA polymerase beta domain protein region [Gloeocapsopsis sp. IPPAS B-1203]